jgi:hypothetical protein
MLPANRDSRPGSPLIPVLSAKVRLPRSDSGRLSVLAGAPDRTQPQDSGPSVAALLISGSEVRVLHGSPAPDPIDLSRPSYVNHPIAGPDHGPLTGSRRPGVSLRPPRQSPGPVEALQGARQDQARCDVAAPASMDRPGRDANAPPRPVRTSPPINPTEGGLYALADGPQRPTPQTDAFTPPERAAPRSDDGPDRSGASRCPSCGSEDPESDRFHGCFGSLSCEQACERCEDAFHDQEPR